MTTVAINIAELETAVAKAKEALDAANASVAVKVAEIMAVVPLDFAALNSASAPVVSAMAALEKATAALNIGRAADRWESSIEVRQPIIDALREAFVDATVVATLVGVTGAINIDVDGKVAVSLTPRFDSVKLDDEAGLVSLAVDALQLSRLDLYALTIEVTALNTEAPVISIAPAGAKATTPKAPKAEGTTEGTRSGALEYLYNGEWLGAKAFLTAVEAAGGELVTAHAQSFQTALHGTGNGLSNLAKMTIGPKLGVETRVKPASE